MAESGRADRSRIFSPLQDCAVILFTMPNLRDAQCYRSRLLCKMCLAFSSSVFCRESSFFPDRLINIWTIRIPEPIPLGLTFFEAMVLAMVSPSLVNRPFGGNVETV